MRGKKWVLFGAFLAFVNFFSPAKLQAAPNIYTGFLHLWLNQHALGTFPNNNFAFFKFYNQDANPVGTSIQIHDSIEFDPENSVELAFGQDAFGNAAWVMFVSDQCAKQVVRQVIDFDSPECQVPEDADPDTTLQAIQSLPSQCLGPRVDACALYDGDLRFDFGSSMAKARKTLENEVRIHFILDGETLASIDRTKPAQIGISAFPASNPDSDLVCSQELLYAPIYAYFFYGYSLPSLKGKCLIEGAAAPLTPLDPGSHTLAIDYGLPGQIFHVSIFQDSP